ncbi:hypothetical protein [Sphingomonas sp. UYP23]
MRILSGALLALSLGLIPAGASAQDNAAILKYAINAAGATYSAYGPTQTSKVVADKTVQGGQAYRVEITAEGPEVYTDGATSPIQKAIAKGDRLFLAFWARAPKLADGKTTPIPFAGLQLAQAPYTQFVLGSVDVGEAWKLYEIRGTADADYPAGQVNVALHLSAEKGTIDLGPVFVLDFGQGKPK